jgi:hypothetical protein
MSSTDHKIPADFLPKADLDLLKLLQEGNVSPKALHSALGLLVKQTIPVQDRAEQRLDDLFKEITEVLKEPRDRHRTLQEWDYVRKLARNGLRLSRAFKVAGVNYPSFFRTIHDTAAHMVANMTVE